MRIPLFLLAIAFLGPTQPASALPKPRPCDGFFNADVQGFVQGAAGLTPSGAPVPNGSSLRFKRMSKIGGKFYLFDARSPRVFDAENIALQTGCLLPDH